MLLNHRHSSVLANNRKLTPPLVLLFPHSQPFITFRKRILIVEGDSDIREDVAEILQLAGYETYTAEGGERALKMVSRQKPDLIICAIVLPEIDGYSVLHWIRSNPAFLNTLFLFLTTRTEARDVIKGMGLGANGYLRKPCDDTDLLDAVQTLFNKDEVALHPRHTNPLK